MNIDFYKEKIEANNILIKKLKSVIRLMPILKLVTFAAIVMFVIVAFRADSGMLYYFGLSFVMLVLFVFLQNRDAKYSNEFAFYSDLNSVYRNEIAFLQNDFSPFYNGEMFADKKHEFSYDLDIFGENSLYHRINRTTTYEGKVRLAQKLVDIPQSEDTVRARQEALFELSDAADFRLRFLAICKRFYSLSNKNHIYIDNAKDDMFLTSKVALWLISSSIAVTAITLLFACLGFLPPWIPMLLLTIQLFIPAIYFGKTNKRAAEVGKLYKNLRRYSQMLALIEKEDFKAKDNILLKEVLFSSHNSLKALNKLADILERFDQRANAYILILLNALYLSDIFLLRNYAQWKQTYSGQLQSWIDALAEFEARISLANYIYNKPDHSMPEIVTDCSVLIEAKEMGHPFISKDKLVTNDFSLYKSNFVIITGANMAGKSTFLRCAGVNYLMAVNGMTVCASEFRCSLFRLFSNMRNTDDLSSGVSYFNAELIRIEQLIEFVRQHSHTLIILDEILKGTNSKDKLKGSIMFLKKMIELPVTGLIATHDLELAKLEDEQSDLFRNYCFEINIDTIDYAYKIQRGVSKNLNATLLLQEILSK